MDSIVYRQVERLHATPTMAVVAVAGGGAQAISWLLGPPGASRTVLEALVPYSSASLHALLGYEPRQVVSPETAQSMARAAYQRARILGPAGAPLVGVGCTAAIATDRPRKGEHRCFASAWNGEETTTYGVTFVKGLRDRSEEEKAVSMLLLRALAEACDVEFDLPLDLDGKEQVEVFRPEHGDLIDSLLTGRVSTVSVHADGGTAADELVRGGVLAGSFDPLHQGHQELASVVASMLQAAVTYELSIANVDKPPLEATEVRKKVAQFAGKGAVVLTRTPTFVEKARLFPGCTFVIGWDTAMRLVDPRYYGGDDHQMTSALTEIRSLCCRFLVAGREEGGVFHTLEEVPIPAKFQEMFTPIPEADFRRDVSSTELRVAGQRS